METLLTDVNWLAVIVGAVLSFMLGWLWYSPKLFGNKWAEGVGINIQDGTGPMGLSMLAQATGTFLLAWVIGVTETIGALSLAILIGLAIATLIKANGLFAQKSMYAIRTEAGFILAMVIVMILTHVLL